MTATAALIFLAGLVLGVRVMFFGVQRGVDEEVRKHRVWPLALAALLMVLGVLLYVRAATRRPVTGSWIALVVTISAASAAAVWWSVKRSAAAPSTDPEDDPRYRFQGHVARIVEPIRRGSGAEATGRIRFEFDGKIRDLRARWVDGSDGSAGAGADPGREGAEVVVERVDGDLAYVEPWQVVEQRL